MSQGRRGLVKICGIRSVDDALAAVDAGADELGLNFVAGRSRAIDLVMAQAIAAAVPPTTQLVSITVDADDALRDSLLQAGVFHGHQLHGDESPARLLEWGPLAYKALGVRSADDVERARDYAGPRVLFDAHAERGPSGGRGVVFAWELLEGFPRSRPWLLAGGLHPGNVANAIARSGADGVDVASGVEHAPGRKDRRAMHDFVRAARQAFAARRTP